MRKRNKVSSKPQTVKTIPANQKWPSILGSGTIIPILVLLLYLTIHFIPDLGAYDAMGPQWLYMVAVDLIVVLFIVARKDAYIEAITAILTNIF